MQLGEMLAYILLCAALAFAGYKIGMLGMKNKMLDFLDFFADYLRDGDTKFIAGRGGPADLIDELSKSLEDEL